MIECLMKNRKKVFKIALTGGGALLLSFGALLLFLDRWGQNDHAAKSDAIIVLGAHVTEQGKASGALRERTLHAVKLYKRGLAAAIITTGGIGTNPPAEARVSADLAIAAGVPARAVFLEDESHSTWENAVNAARICRFHGWRRVIIVSEPYHLFRARANFRKQGLQTVVSPSPNYVFSRRLTMTSREVVLVLRDFLLRKL